MLLFVPYPECVHVDREDGTLLGQIHLNPLRYLPYGAAAVSVEELREIADEMAHFSSDESIPRARKSYKCRICSGVIEPGDLYMRAEGLERGYKPRWCTDHYCGACELARQKIHEIEIDRGCEWDESWCPPEELLGVISEGEHGVSMPSKAEGQEHLAQRKGGAK